MVTRVILFLKIEWHFIPRVEFWDVNSYRYSSITLPKLEYRVSKVPRVNTCILRVLNRALNFELASQSDLKVPSIESNLFFRNRWSAHVFMAYTDEGDVTSGVLDLGQKLVKLASSGTNLGFSRSASVRKWDKSAYYVWPILSHSQPDVFWFVLDWIASFSKKNIARSKFVVEDIKMSISRGK